MHELFIHIMGGTFSVWIRKQT